MGGQTARVVAFDPDAAGELDSLLFRQDGVLAWRQARRFMTDKKARHQVDSGRWHKVNRAVYVTHTGPITERQRLWIACLAVGAKRPAVLGGVSALRSMGMRGLRARPIHVLLPASRQDRDTPAGVLVHRTRHFTRADCHPTSAPPCTWPARSMIDAASWAASDQEAVTIIAATFQQRLVRITDVAPVLARLPRLRRRRVIVAAVRDAASGAESTFEIDFARLCRRAGLPEPTRQAVRRDVRVRKRYRDAYFEEWKVHVEIDGSQHMNVDDWYADMRQHNEVIIAGERLLRFAGWMVRSRPEEVAAVVRVALLAAGWTPPP